MRSSEKIDLFRQVFSGLENIYGTYDPATGRAMQVKAPVSDKVVRAHLTGRQPYGVYLLVKDRIRAIAVDFDANNPIGPAEFVARAKHYQICAYLERSKSKGYHTWIFFPQEGVKAQKARLVVRHILAEIDRPEIEIFPKQDALEGNVRYGNFINAPLFGDLVPRGRTVFVDPATYEPYTDQWALLESVVRHTESALDTILEINDISLDTPDKLTNEGNDKGDKTPFSLPPCVQTMCMDGVTEYQRVSCFRLAVQFRRLGLPYDMAVAALKIWALKNRPRNGKGVIREDEIISQAAYAYQHDYRGYGCESIAIKPFCDPSCPVNGWRQQKKRLQSKERNIREGIRR